MADVGGTEEIPNRLVMAELEQQLHAKTSELVVANARIRSRDEQIHVLEEHVAKLLGEKAGLLEDRYGPAV